jgi:hypothetical protein
MICMYVYKFICMYFAQNMQVRFLGKETFLKCFGAQVKKIVFRWLAIVCMCVYCKKGTKLHFKSPTAERRHVLCVGVGRDQTHASRPGGAGYAPFAN